MKGIKRAGGLLCFLGCVAALAGILATAVPMIDNDQLQTIVRSFSDPVSDGFLKFLNSVLSFCLKQNYLVFIGGIALLLIGGVMRTLADKALIETRHIASEAAPGQFPPAEDNTTLLRDNFLPTQETVFPVNAPFTAEDFRPQIIVKPMKGLPPEVYDHSADLQEESINPIASEDIENSALQAEPVAQAEENPIPASENLPEETNEPQPLPYREHPEWAYTAPTEQTGQAVSDQTEERTERPATDASTWETREATDERVIIAKRESSVTEVKIPDEVTEPSVPMHLSRVSAPTEPTPMEQYAMNCCERRPDELKPATPYTENPFQQKTFRLEGRPAVITTLPNTQFRFEQSADAAPPFQAGEYEENDTQTLPQNLRSGVRIISTLGRESQR